MSLCCWGGMPSFSSTLSLIRSTFIHMRTCWFHPIVQSYTAHPSSSEFKSNFTLSVGSMSISISFPVRVWNTILWRWQKCGFWILTIKKTKKKKNQAKFWGGCFLETSATLKTCWQRYLSLFFSIHWVNQLRNQPMTFFFIWFPVGLPCFAFVSRLTNYNHWSITGVTVFDKVYFILQCNLNSKHSMD